MTPDEFKAAIETLGYSPAGIAKVFGVNGRTGRRWALGANPIPDTVAAQIRAMLAAGGITPSIKAEAETRRLEGDADMTDTLRFIWVRLRGRDPQWVVAEHDRLADIYYLPGRADRFIANELDLGPVVKRPGG